MKCVCDCWRLEIRFGREAEMAHYFSNGNGLVSMNRYPDNLVKDKSDVELINNEHDMNGRSNKPHRQPISHNRKNGQHENKHPWQSKNYNFQKGSKEKRKEILQKVLIMAKEKGLIIKKNQFEVSSYCVTLPHGGIYNAESVFDLAIYVEKY
jgi:hypothetical protein